MKHTIYTAQMLMVHTMILIILWAIVGFETMATWYGIYHLLWHTWGTLTVFHHVGKESDK